MRPLVFRVEEVLSFTEHRIEALLNLLDDVLGASQVNGTTVEDSNGNDIPTNELIERVLLCAEFLSKLHDRVTKTSDIAFYLKRRTMDVKRYKEEAQMECMRKR
ncbi:unnamed protein product [Heligmosomoides polygyrus]|uniref:MitMem_reg domain-containing protein n=1 Tax=Heligmosomoides polygyrus TaxID=6339 RepID=A0A183F3G2_HELPZ|nr:unnamed protein product [Heligmosomoides polygyrus]